MFKGKSWLAVGLCMVPALLSLFPLPLTAQEVDGVYQGVFGKQPVSASFNKLEFSLTGMLFVGDERYVLLADDTDSGYSGQLTNIDTGEVSKVELGMKEGRLTIMIKDGAKPITFQLDKTKQ